MSELKVYVKPLKTNVLGQTIVGQSYYLKSEADKVIAELKAQKAQAEDDCAYWKMNEGNAANAMHETEEYAMQLYRSDRHNKYKRCLAMAEACMHKRWRTDEGFDYARSTRHMNKWLELAEKFKDKEAK